jgi:hypothetical protein
MTQNVNYIRKIYLIMTYIHTYFYCVPRWGFSTCTNLHGMIKVIIAPRLILLHSYNLLFLKFSTIKSSPLPGINLASMSFFNLFLKLKTPPLSTYVCIKQVHECSSYLGWMDFWRYWSNYFKLYVIQAKAKYRPMCSLTYLNTNHLVRVAKISWWQQYSRFIQNVDFWFSRPLCHNNAVSFKLEHAQLHKQNFRLAFDVRVVQS